MGFAFLFEVSLLIRANMSLQKAQPFYVSWVVGYPPLVESILDIGPPTSSFTDSRKNYLLCAFLLVCKPTE